MVKKVSEETRIGLADGDDTHTNEKVLENIKDTITATIGESKLETTLTGNIDKSVICPKCAKKMIKKFHNSTYLTFPSQQRYDWWCGCGHSYYGGVYRHKTDEEMLKEEWDKVNV